jgi:CRISPR-associated DxTHG motif protein
MRLVTVLGLNPRETEYVLDGHSCRASLAPIAITSLYDGIDEVVALCTREAEKETLPLLRVGLGSGSAVRIESKIIPEVRTQQEVESLLAVVRESLDGREAILDVTHGFRHLSLLVFGGVLYLSAISRCQIRGIFYGLLGDARSLLLDLRPLVELTTLAFAAGELRQRGSVGALVERIRVDASQEAKQVAAALDGLASAFGAGLPLELGAEAAKFQKGYGKRLQRWLEHHRVPFASDLVDSIGRTLGRFAIRALVSHRKVTRVSH